MVQKSVKIGQGVRRKRKSANKLEITKDTKKKSIVVKYVKGAKISKFEVNDDVIAVLDGNHIPLYTFAIKQGEGEGQAKNGTCQN